MWQITLPETQVSDFGNAVKEWHVTKTDEQGFSSFFDKKFCHFRVPKYVVTHIFAQSYKIKFTRNTVTHN